MKSTPVLSLITVNYGHLAQIERLVASLRADNSSLAWELLIVDNASPHDQGTSLEEKFHSQPNIHVFTLESNRGFGSANNYAVRFAKGDIITFINPDVEVLPGCMEAIFSESEQRKSAICTPVLQNPDGTLQENTRDFPRPKELFFRRIFGTGNTGTAPSKVQAVPWAHGSFLTLHKDFFTRELKGFDPRFFLFFEDMDLCRRAWVKGTGVYQVPAARAVHGEHRLSGGMFLIAIFKKTFWYHLSSAWKYYRKYRGRALPPISKHS